jgi:enoyl-CoA hydratase/carnithine racemase
MLCDIWRDFRDDPAVRVAVITGSGDAFTAGADLKTHAPEWQTVGPMVGRERLEDGLCGITRGPLSRITKPIVAAINGWCVGHGVELAMACDIRIASERAQFGTFEVRLGMHPADGGIVRLVNTCGVGVALELLLTGEPISAQRALTANMVARVVPHDSLMEETDALVQRILRCDQAAIESAKETVLEIIGRPCMTSCGLRPCGVMPCAAATPRCRNGLSSSSTRSTAGEPAPPPLRCDRGAAYDSSPSPRRLAGQPLTGAQERRDQFGITKRKYGSPPWAVARRRPYSQSAARPGACTRRGRWRCSRSPT